MVSRFLLGATLCSALISARGVAAQNANTPSAAAPPPVADVDQPAMTQAELEQLVASIALYPDALLSQILMASTYPVEVVQAERWAKANSSLKDQALAAALDKQTWDASVKSLVQFPDILSMMSEKLDTTIKLGDAFIGQQKQVMDAIQSLRNKAKAQGNLESNKEQTVTTEAGTGGTQTIIIQPTDPEVIYVPSYNPTVVYGSWPYPAYPPYPYYPPGYIATGVISFGVGMALGAAWGHAWGGCDWHGGNVNVDVNRNTNFNRNVDRSERRDGDRGREGTRGDGNRGGAGDRGGAKAWQHDGSHRKGTPYRDSKTASQFGGKSASQAAQSREAYRGRTESGRQDLARGGADQFKGAGASNRAGGQAGQGAQGAGNRQGAAGGASAGNRQAAGGGTGAGNRQGAAGGQRSGGSASNNAFGGSNRSGASARQESSRGSASRGSSGSRGGASRGGGGGGRMGGGGGGRGGGGRR